MNASNKGVDARNIPPMTQRSFSTSQERSSQESNGSESVTFEVNIGEDTPTQVDQPTQVQQPTFPEQQPQIEDEEEQESQPLLPACNDMVSSPDYDKAKLDSESSESGEEDDESIEDEKEELEDGLEIDEGAAMWKGKRAEWPILQGLEEEEEEVEEGERGSSDEEKSSDEESEDEEEEVVIVEKETIFPKKNRRGRDAHGLAEPYRQMDVIIVDSQDSIEPLGTGPDHPLEIAPKEENEADFIGVGEEEEEEEERTKKVIVTDKKSGDMEVVYFDTQCKYTTFFNSRKDQNKDQKFRIGILENFVATPSMDMLLLFHKDIRDEPDLVALRDFLRRTKTRKSKFWTKEVISVQLATLVFMLKKSDVAVAAHRRSSFKEPTAIASFRAFLNKVEKRMKIDESTEEAMIKRGKRPVKTSAKKNALDETLQEEIVRTNPKWSKLVDNTMKCPNCLHNLLVPMVPWDRIERETSRLRREYEKAVEAGDKPKVPTYPKQVYMCMCRVNTCRDVDLGTGCKMCENRCKMKLPSLYDGVKGLCLCETCQCECEISFPRKKWTTIYHQTHQATLTKERKNKLAAQGSGKCLQPFIYLFMQ